MLIDERKAVEGRSRHDDLEVVARTGAVEHGYLGGVGKRLPQKLLETVGRHEDIMPGGLEAVRTRVRGSRPARSERGSERRSNGSDLSDVPVGDC